MNVELTAVVETMHRAIRRDIPVKRAFKDMVKEGYLTTKEVSSVMYNWNVMNYAQRLVDYSKK